jgi:hypothetical protein
MKHFARRLFITYWRIRIMLDTGKMDAAIAALRTGVSNLLAENAALKAAVDPQAQSKMDAAAAEVQSISDSIPVISPPPGA